MTARPGRTCEVSRSPAPQVGDGVASSGSASAAIIRVRLLQSALSGGVRTGDPVVRAVEAVKLCDARSSGYRWPAGQLLAISASGA
jgi:hypothetical protein